MLLEYGSEEVYPLPGRLVEELGAGMEMLYSNLTESLCALMTNQDVQDTWLYNQLPYFARLRCDTRLCRDFLITLSTLAFKTFGPSPFPIACRAEELLLAWAADEVEAFREMGGEKFEDKEDFLGEIIGDLDFQLMYDPAFDGIDQAPYLRTGSFRLEDWFRPYPIVGAVTNPLTWPEKIAYQHHNWRHFPLE